MKKAFSVALLAPAVAFAHPGHGLPGWIHPHVADYALIGLGISFLAALAYGLKKLLTRK